jgi:hypothetical protein
MTNNPEHDESLAAQIRQMVLTTAELNSRIARLAIGLGLSLQNRADVEKVMHWQDANAIPLERRSTANRRQFARSGDTHERRVAHTWGELRGLMVLRYKIEKEFVEEVGVTAARQILTNADNSMFRMGFKHGADGSDLDHLFDGV